MFPFLKPLTRNVTALRALNMAMSLVAVISLGSFAYGVQALSDSPAVLEQATGRMDVRQDHLIGQRDGDCTTAQVCP
jgi:hypothetical protein